MKKTLLTLFLLLTSLLSFTQILRNDKYEMYLLDFMENEVSIAKGMYMTDRPQYYYEGTIEVTSMDNGASSKYNFFFSTWDDSFKEFQVKDVNYKIEQPIVTFKGKSKAIIKKENKELHFKLEDTSSVENSILSSMVIWLDCKKNSALVIN